MECVHTLQDAAAELNYSLLQHTTAVTENWFYIDREANGVSQLYNGFPALQLTICVGKQTKKCQVVFYLPFKTNKQTNTIVK